MLKGQTQHRIASAEPGVYVAASTAAYSRSPGSVIAFAEVLGYEPHADPRLEWQLGLVTAGLPVLAETATGARELEVQLPARTQAERPSVSAEAQAWFCPGLSVATHRTATGAPEREWRAKTK